MKLRDSRSSSLIIVALCTLLIPGGCGKNADRVPVAGVVLIDGKPLTYGKISFSPIGGGARPVYTDLNDKGEFDFGVEGVKKGPNRVAVMALEQMGDTGFKLHAPKKYADGVTSGLEENVQTATGNLMINLTWDGMQPETIRASGEGGTRG